MTKELWLNLPVKDLKKAKEFYKQLGFSFKEERDTPVMSAMIVGTKKIAVMLVTIEQFEKYAQLKISDTKQGCEILISFDAETREEVDQLAASAEKAGGLLFAKPSEILGWMYGCAFADLDGHRWNALYMDMSKAPK